MQEVHGVFQRSDGWYFRDNQEDFIFGPFLTKEDADRRFEEYLSTEDE